MTVLVVHSTRTMPYMRYPYPCGRMFMHWPQMSNAEDNILKENCWLETEEKSIRESLVRADRCSVRF